MLTHEENMLMCRVEGDAPMGQLMRRHWQVVCLAEEVPEPDGTPVRARVLGENLADCSGLGRHHIIDITPANP